MPGTTAMLHATGFCKEVWKPVVAELRSLGHRQSVVLWDQPGHGHTRLREGNIDWWDAGHESFEVVGGRPRPVTGVGHSSGGAALAMAEISRPGTFEQLLLFEPIVFPPPYGPFESDLYHATLRRRDEFDSHRSAMKHLRTKPAFATWDERALSAYVEGGLERGENGHWRWRCRPQVEADYYRSAGMHRAWERLGEIEAPVVLVAGEHSDTHGLDFLEAQAARFRQAEVEVVPGLGHLFPMEDPAKTARVIDHHVRRLAGTARIGEDGSSQKGDHG